MTFNSKKGAGDFLVLLIVSLLMIFTLFMFNALMNIDRNRNVVPETFREQYTQDIIRFLRTPASLISNEYESLLFAEYIVLAFQSQHFDNKFIETARKFTDSICLRYHESTRGCYFEIRHISCLADARNIESTLEGDTNVARTNTRSANIINILERCQKRFPEGSQLGNSVASLRFYGQDMNIYEVELRVRT